MTDAQKRLLLLLAESELNDLQSLDNEITDKSQQIDILREAIAAVEQESQ